MFDTIMRAREVQAKNLGDFLVVQAQKYNLPIVIHGKAYKPDVPYCIGSYSTLVGYYVKQAGHKIHYVDPLADDLEDVVDWSGPAVVLLAHNREVTYGYTGKEQEDVHYFDFAPGSYIVDPWRKFDKSRTDIKVCHYGNTRGQ
jgi:UDPglucose 6-dehydrogenase